MGWKSITTMAESLCIPLMLQPIASSLADSRITQKEYCIC